MRLAPLRRLRALDKLSDEDMVNFQRVNLLDSSAPNPSVETLLHAFLPHKFIDHTHSTAVLALTDQPDGEAVVREVYRRPRGLCALHDPGLRARQKRSPTSSTRIRRWRASSCCSTAFSRSATNAREAYERMIEFVTLAEERLRAAAQDARSRAKLPAKLAKRRRYRADPARRGRDLARRAGRHGEAADPVTSARRPRSSIT